MIPMLTYGPLTIARPEWLVVGGVFFIIMALMILMGNPGLSWRSRLLLVVSRLLIISCIALALTDPSMVQQRSTNNLGEMVILMDESASMAPYNLSVEQIDQRLDVPARVQRIARGERSPLIGGITSSLSPHGVYLLISDGQATDGSDFTSVAATAQQLNATIHSLQLPGTYDDASVVIDGPSKTVVGALNTYRIQVSGNTKLSGELIVTIDGREVLRTDDLDTVHTVSESYDTAATRSIEAKITTKDRFDKNNRFAMTTKVTPKPRVLSMGGDDRFNSFLSRIFDVDVATALPEDMEEYSAIVSHNQPASRLDADRIQDFVAEGNGLALFGGANSFDFGNYDSSQLAPVIPVKNGRTGEQARSSIVLAVDISFSSKNIDELAKTIAYDVIADLSADNLVGVVAYHEEPFIVSDLALLKQGRDELLSKVSRLKNQEKGTRHNAGLRGAYELLKDMSGPRSIILLTDGQIGGGDDAYKSQQIVDTLAEDNIQVFSVGVGPASQIKESALRQWAGDTGGAFLRATQTDRLNVRFGKYKKSAELDTFTLSIVDDAHPITQGVGNPETTLNNVNAVLPKRGARPLAVTAQGDTAMTVWNYGLGRVATWTAYTGVDGYGRMLSEPDSLVLVRMLTWAAGDPQRKNPPLFQVEDTRVGDQARILASAPSLDALARNLGVERSALDSYQLTASDDDRYQGSIVPSKLGLHDELGARYAVNYPSEYDSLGQQSVVEALARSTGGKYLNASALESFDEVVIDQLARSYTTVSYAWLCLTVALFLFTLEIISRKVGEHSRND